MKTIFFPDQTLNDDTYVATIGFFDGVHQGHQFLMAQLRKEAAERGMRSMAITFESHPRQVVQGGWKPELLTDLHEKLRLLKTTGIDTVVVLRFNRQMAAFSARDFMQLMYERMGVRVLLTGYDNRFGHDRAEGFEDYQCYGRELGIEVLCGDALAMGKQNVSSSRVRQLLKEGNVEEANYCLGRPYSLGGQVVHGEQIGRTMGIMNIGTRPTFNGTNRTLETNLLEPIGNIYGHRLNIHFIARLRSEQQFPSADALALQIQKDKEQAEQILSNYHF